MVDGGKSCRSKSMPHSSLSRTSSGLASICPITAWQARRDHFNCASSNVMSTFEQSQHSWKATRILAKGMLRQASLPVSPDHLAMVPRSHLYGPGVIRRLSTALPDYSVSSR